MTDTLTFAPLEVARLAGGWQVPFVAGTGWGVATFRESTLTIQCHAGHFDVRAIRLDGSALPLEMQVVVPGKPLTIPAP
jgi:hypothetical protein